MTVDNHSLWNYCPRLRQSTKSGDGSSHQPTTLLLWWTAYKTARTAGREIYIL